MTSDKSVNVCQELKNKPHNTAILMKLVVLVTLLVLFVVTYVHASASNCNDRGSLNNRGQGGGITVLSFDKDDKEFDGPKKQHKGGKHKKDHKGGDYPKEKQDHGAKHKNNDREGGKQKKHQKNNEDRKQNKKHGGGKQKKDNDNNKGEKKSKSEKKDKEDKEKKDVPKERKLATDKKKISTDEQDKDFYQSEQRHKDKKVQIVDKGKDKVDKDVLKKVVNKDTAQLVSKKTKINPPQSKSIECKDIGTKGTCCFDCEQPSYRSDPEVKNSTLVPFCTCNDNDHNFRFDMPKELSGFTGGDAPCYPLKTIPTTIQGPIHNYISQMLNFCVQQKKCTCKNPFEAQEIVIKEYVLILFYNIDSLIELICTLLNYHQLVQSQHLIFNNKSH